MRQRLNEAVALTRLTPAAFATLSRLRERVPSRVAARRVRGL
jgi:hypothetical protein